MRILRIDERLLAFIHADNLENYSKHAQDPSQALTSVLAVAAQQPTPKDKIMVLIERLSIII